MISRIFRNFRCHSSDLVTSQLYNEQTFYPTLERDLACCRNEAVIESPFLTSNRVASLLPIFIKMRSRNIKIVVNTRHPSEHNAPYDRQAWDAIEQMQDVGVEVLFTGGHHRKLAIFDRQILWEGSLNILSQNDSCEIMRRMESSELAKQMLSFTKLDRY
jgi:hypothetical protein